MTKIDFIDQTLTGLTITTTATATTTNNNNNKLKFILPPNSIISHPKKKNTCPKFDQKLMLQKLEENTHNTLFDLQKLNC